MVSVSCASTGVVVVGWSWRLCGGGRACAVESDAGRRVGLESTVGSAVVSGEEVRGEVSSSRTEIWEG